MSVNNLKKKYQEEIVPRLLREFGLKSSLAVPRVIKIVVNMGVGEGAKDKGLLEAPALDLARITGQKPKITKSRVAIAGFRLREGAPIGLMVTLRGVRMYDFLEKLFKIIFPRLRDFQGLSTKSFDGRGNFNIGIPEMVVFPEAEYSQAENAKGLQVTLITNTNDNQKAKRLLELMGLPFEKKEQESKRAGEREKKREQE